MKQLAKLLAVFVLAGSAFAQQQVQPVAGVLTLNLVPGTTAFKVILSANVTSVVIVNPTPGTIISVIFTENATGGFTVTFGGNIANPCGVNTSANATTTCQFQYDATSNTWNGLGGSSVLPNNPLPAATSGPGPVFNVKNYGAKGALKSSVNGSFGAGSLTVTCSDCNFSTNAALNDTICAAPSGNTSPCSYITSITNNTTVQTNVAISSQTNTGNVYWGTFGGPSVLYDDTAVGLAQTAAQAVVKNSGSQNYVNKTALTSAPILYFPTGHYLLCTQNLFDSGSNQGFQFVGDGNGSTIITWAQGCTIGGGQPGALTVGGSYTRIKDITFDSMFGGPGGTSFNTLLYLGGGFSELQDIVVSNTGLNGIISQASIIGYNVITHNSSATGFNCNGCQGEMRSGGSSNNATNIIITNVTGSAGGEGFRWYGGLIDETGGNCPTQISNSQDVWFIGTAFFSTTGQAAVCVTQGSYIHFNGGIIGWFQNDTNTSGLTIDATSTVEASDTRFIGTGTGKPINNSGILINNGANTLESGFAIASGTSTGTAAVITVTTKGANLNTNCNVGDTLIVEGATIIAYNGKWKYGITATSATTVSYTTVGSNLGALGAGGTVYCLNNQQNYAGTLPEQTLAPSQFNCNIPVLTATTTTATTNCFFTPDRDIQLTRFSAGMGTAPVTCSPNAIVQVSNGTNTQNLTISAAQNDTGALSSPVFLLKNTKIGVIVQTAAAGCGTSPANAAVNLYWKGLIDN